MGMQSDFTAALKDLVELDFDAVEAYEAAINRLNNAEYKSKLTEFKSDHERHITELSGVLKNHGEEAPTGPSIGKQWIAKGKVILAEIIGDNGILVAMKTNEMDTNIAYERMNAREDKWLEAVYILQRGLEDEKKHKSWLESVIKS